VNAFAAQAQGGEDSTARRSRGSARIVLAGVLTLLALLALSLAGVAASIGGSSVTGSWLDATELSSDRYGVSARARAEIPPAYLRLYMLAARRYGLDWAVLAAIGKVECDHGRDPDPPCTREGAVNSAGAGGPAQFLASTWSEYGVSADGGVPDRWNPADAILAMANYLRASGAPGSYRRAIYAYNHAWWYVAEVERWAAIYRGPAPAGGEAGVSGPVTAGGEAETSGSAAEGGLTASGTGGAPVQEIPGERAELSPTDGHLALVPEDVPPAVQAMVIAGNELQDLPYGPAGHPDPLGASSEDCSSTVNYVLYLAGVRPLAEILRENPLAQDYISWGLPGPGRWVTIYATTAPTPHVFVVLAGLRLDTSHDGTDVGPNRDQDGPRWRVLGHIPAWAHWSVRHPPWL
jgi:hypothetical protein